MNHYGLDLAWYISAPGLAWDTALKITKVQLELLIDSDMLLTNEMAAEQESQQYHTATLKPTMNIWEQSSILLRILNSSRLDANKLYGWAMSKQLPTSGFKWMTDDELDDCKHMSCILEVDLEYAEDLHDLHNDYSLAPKRVKIGNVVKLISNLNNKTNYVVYNENLKLYQSLGLKITKIHRGIKFQESLWLEEYINLNTELRTKVKQSGNNFEEDFFKQMNNSVFGKTLENIRNRVDIRLISTDKVAQKLAAKPSYDCCTIFDKNLIAVHMKKKKLYFNKPVYLGMRILDLSKSLMYDFHYNYIKTTYGANAKLLFTETESLADEIRTKDFYKDINHDIEKRFDTSDYPTNHPSGIKTGLNSKVL